MRGILLLCLSLIFFACQSDVSDINLIDVTKDEQVKNTVALSLSGAIELPLDQYTPMQLESVSFTQRGDTMLYSFINPANNSVYQYDLSTGKLLKQTRLEIEGPNGVGALGQAQTDHLLRDNGDIIICNGWDGQVYIISPDGDVKKKITLLDYSNNQFAVFPTPYKDKRLLLKGEKLYITCSPTTLKVDSYEAIAPILEVDLENGMVQNIGQLPGSYNYGYWGSGYRYQPAITLNKTTEELLLSFPIDPNIYSLNEQSDLDVEGYANSKHIKVQRPFSENIAYIKNKSWESYNQKVADYTFSSPYFSSFYHDPYNGYYYRLVGVWPSEEELKKGNTRPDFSIIIMDENFNKIGETFFKREQYDAFMALVTPEGLALPRVDLYKQNEDAVTFEFLEVKKI